MKKIFSIACVAMLFMTANMFGQGNRSLQVGTTQIDLDAGVSYTISHDNTAVAIKRAGTPVTGSPFAEDTISIKVNPDQYPDRTIDHIDFSSENIATWVGTIANRKAHIFWNTAPDKSNFVKTELVYNKVDDATVTTVTVDVWPADEWTPCPDAEQKMRFQKYRSVYQIEGTEELYYGEWQQWTFPETSLYLVGYMMPGGHDPAQGWELPFDPENPWVYTVTYDIPEQKSFRFLSIRDWGGFNVRPILEPPTSWVMRGTTQPIRVYDFHDTAIDTALGATDNDFFTGDASQAGLCLITVDLNNLTITYTPQD